MAEIKLKNLTKRWGNFVGVDSFNLDIQDKEFLVLLGPSGCGKTTTMRMIAGLEEVSEGEIWIENELVNLEDPKDRDVAMVFQSYALYPNMTVYENIKFPLKVRKIEKSKHHEMVLRAAEKVELSDLLERKPSELSGGQRQRVALARAIVREPRVFLMDEPLSNLDAKLRISTRAEIKNLQHELSTTTIYVTHDQIEAMTLADRVVVMNEGKIQQVGTPAQIYETPSNTFVAGFIGSPAMNLISGNIKDGSFKQENLKISGLTSDVSGEVILGFRAEDAEVVTNSPNLSAQVFSFELLGDATMVTVKTDNQLISIKAKKDYRVNIGETIKVKIPSNKCHLFNVSSGESIMREVI